jgi:hypothetical protein
MRQPFETKALSGRWHDGDRPVKRSDDTRHDLVVLQRSKAPAPGIFESVKATFYYNAEKT